jgi:predicted permease
MSAGVVLQQMVIIFILVMTGYALSKKKILGDGASGTLSALVINACNPALLLSSCFDRDPSVTNRNILLGVAAGAVVYAVLILSSFLIPRLLRVEKKWKNHYAMMCIFGNTGFIGIPLIQALLGSKAMIYVIIVNIYYNLFFYTYGYYLAGGENSRFSPKSLLNIGNLSMVLGIVVFLWQPKVPVLVESTLVYIANATTFLAILVIGINLAKSDLKPIFTQLRLYIFVALRFVAIPVLVAAILRLFVKDDVMYGVMVILSAVPVANLPLMRVEETGGDGTVLSQGIILSTLLSIATVPLVSLFL